MAEAKKTTKKVAKSKVVQFCATGRRKQSIARVRLVPGNGQVTINNKDINEYFGLGTLRLIVNQPLELTNTKEKYDVLVNVHGGGLTGQAGAIKHGISKALDLYEPELRACLKKAGFLTRDDRTVERKKYGKAKARRSYQFSKR